MKLKSARRAQAEMIGTLVMVAASALLTTIMLFWGLALQGQGTQNFGNAIARTNAAAEEQISIDNVLFQKVTGTCAGVADSQCTTACGTNTCYNLTIYTRNYGDTPLKLAGVHLALLTTGVSPVSYDCEASTSSSSKVHQTIVARQEVPISLARVPISYMAGCYPSVVWISSNWAGQTISVGIATEAGTLFKANYAVPA